MTNLGWRQLQNYHRLNGSRWTWSISVLNQDCLFRLKSFNNRTSSIYMIHIIWTSSILSRSRLLHIIRYYWRLNYIAESNSLIASCGMIHAIKNLVAPFQISFISDVSLALDSNCFWCLKMDWVLPNKNLRTIKKTEIELIY